MIYRLRLIACLFVFVSSNSFSQTCADLNGAYVLAQDANNTYLGFFGNQFANDSINNSFGPYGSTFSSTSVRNTFSSYGSSFGIYSAQNNFATSPPIIYKGLTALAYLTTNTFQTPGLPLALIDASCTFTATEPVIGPVNNPAVFFNPQSSGNLVVGATLTFSIEYLDPDGVNAGLFILDIWNDYTIQGYIGNVSSINGQFVVTNDMADKILTWRFGFYDNLNNLEESPDYYLGTVASLANQAPVITSSPITTATEDTAYIYNIIANDPDGDALSFSGSGPTWLSYDGNSLAGTPTNDDVGSATVTITLTDPGGLSDTQTFTLTVINTNDAPIIISVPNQQVTEGQEYTYAITFTDPDVGDGYDLNVSFPAWMDFDDATNILTGTPNSQQIGSHTIQVTLTDNAGLSDFQSFDLEVIDDPAIPNIDEATIPMVGSLGLLVLGLSMLGLGALRVRRK